MLCLVNKSACVGKNLRLWLQRVAPYSEKHSNLHLSALILVRVVFTPGCLKTLSKLRALFLFTASLKQIETRALDLPNSSQVRTHYTLFTVCVVLLTWRRLANWAVLRNLEAPLQNFNGAGQSPKHFRRTVNLYHLCVLPLNTAPKTVTLNMRAVSRQEGIAEIKKPSTLEEE